MNLPFDGVVKSGEMLAAVAGLGAFASLYIVKYIPAFFGDWTLIVLAVILIYTVTLIKNDHIAYFAVGVAAMFGLSGLINKFLPQYSPMGVGTTYTASKGEVAYAGAQVGY